MGGVPVAGVNRPSTALTGLVGPVGCRRPGVTVHRQEAEPIAAVPIDADTDP
jgi:hypothetical protein